jgi:hypothetical protein
MRDQSNAGAPEDANVVNGHKPQQAATIRLADKIQPFSNSKARTATPQAVETPCASCRIQENEAVSG